MRGVLIGLIAVVTLATSVQVASAGPGVIEQAKLTAGDAAAGDFFGDAVAISGDTVVVGAPLDDLGVDAGSAYVFERNAGGANNWGQVAKLTAGDPAPDVQFGSSVAISGPTLVVGAPGPEDGNITGSVYVFVGGGSTWTEQAKLTASDPEAGDGFGKQVAISDVNTVVVGAELHDGSLGLNSGAAYVFELSDSTWIEVVKLTAFDAEALDEFGASVAIGGAGNSVVVGAVADHHGGKSDAGSAYVFNRNEGGLDAWGLEAKLTASDAATGDLFGCCSDIDVDTVVAACEQLQWLDLSFTQVTDEGVGSMRNLKNLRQLSLERTRVTDNSLDMIASFSELEELDLSGTAVTDAGVAKLARLQNLKVLWLTNTTVTDEVLTTLKSLKNLEQSDVDGTQVSEAAWSEFRKRFDGGMGTTHHSPP